jgi:hypothetical protein
MPASRVGIGRASAPPPGVGTLPASCCTKPPRSGLPIVASPLPAAAASEVAPGSCASVVTTAPAPTSGPGGWGTTPTEDASLPPGPVALVGELSGRASASEVRGSDTPSRVVRNPHEVPPTTVVAQKTMSIREAENIGTAYLLVLRKILVRVSTLEAQVAPNRQSTMWNLYSRPSSGDCGALAKARCVENVFDPLSSVLSWAVEASRDTEISSSGHAHQA